MYKPKAYRPEQGYRFQIFTRGEGWEWEHCDYARDIAEKRYLINEYTLAYGSGFAFRVVELPQKYWA